MKIVNISGGLGNQMFQYAFAVSLKAAFPLEDVYIDTSHYHTLLFKHYRGVNLHNGYEIDKVFPNSSLPIAGWARICRLSYYIPNYVLSRIGRKVFPKRKTEFVPPYNLNYSFIPEAYQPGDRYYEGYWQCIRYFEGIKSQLQVIFAHSQPNELNRALIEQISVCDSVGIHVRRGDYLDEPEFRDICGTEYYNKGIRKILSDGKKHEFFVFSNDIPWCKENLEPLLDKNSIHYVDVNKGKDSCWDMFLMTYCKDLIIANSSFSWWGAFLNKRDGIVIAPDPWVNRECEISIYDNNWIKIKG